MSEQLLIHMAADGHLAWRASATGAHGQGAPPAPVVNAAGRVVVLVPGEAVLLTTASLPPGSHARLAKVLPYALEDRLLDDVDRLHFVAGARAGDGQHAVAVVAREAMQSWCQQLADAGIEADVMLPDTLAVPRDGDAPTALALGERCLVRLAADQGFVCRFQTVAQWMDVPQGAHLLVPRGAEAPALPAGSPWQLRQVEAPPRLWSTDDAPALNLLSGDYAARHRGAWPRRLWRLAAALAALAIGITVVTQGVSIVRLQAANADADKAIKQQYARLFPDAPEVPNPVARVRSELQRLGGHPQSASSGLVAMLWRAGPILASNDFRLQLQGLEYRNQSLELTVHAPDLAKLDGLRERLATLPGFKVELETATPGEHGIDGRISMTASGT